MWEGSLCSSWNRISRTQSAFCKSPSVFLKHPPVCSSNITLCPNKGNNTYGLLHSAQNVSLSLPQSFKGFAQTDLLLCRQTSQSTSALCLWWGGSHDDGILPGMDFDGFSKHFSRTTLLMGNIRMIWIDLSFCVLFFWYCVDLNICLNETSLHVDLGQSTLHVQEANVKRTIIPLYFVSVQMSGTKKKCEPA